MHVGASTLFPAVYACDAFVDMSSYDWGDADAQKWARVSRLGAKNSVAVAGKLAFVPRANAQDERKHCYAVLLIRHIDPSITFALSAPL